MTVCCGEFGYVTYPILFCHDCCEKGSTVCCFSNWRASYFACHKIRMSGNYRAGTFNMHSFNNTRHELCHFCNQVTAHQVVAKFGEMGLFYPKQVDISTRAWPFIFLWLIQLHCEELKDYGTMVWQTAMDVKCCGHDLFQTTIPVFTWVSEENYEPQLQH